MSVHEKIRLIRETKGLTQEEVAEKLEMSINGYGDIERGITDIKLSKLEKIAELLEIRLSELFELNERNVLNITYCKQKQNNFYMNSSAVELEKQLLINELKEREIVYLKEINALLKKENV